MAEHLRETFCADGHKANWAETVYEPWFGCERKPNTKSSPKGNRDLCKETYPRIYDEAGDSLWVVATEGSERDGGVQDRLCVWSSEKPSASGSGFECFLYDPASREGNMKVDDVEGTDSATNPNGWTPLAVACISLTNPDGTAHEGTKYAVFPKARTGYARTLIKGVPEDEYSRDSRLGPDGNGWYPGVVDGRFLYVRQGANEECEDAGAASAAVCEWTRM